MTAPPEASEPIPLRLLYSDREPDTATPALSLVGSSDWIAQTEATSAATLAPYYDDVSVDQTRASSDPSALFIPVVVAAISAVAMIVAAIVQISPSIVHWVNHHGSTESATPPRLAPAVAAFTSRLESLISSQMTINREPAKAQHGGHRILLTKVNRLRVQDTTLFAAADQVEIYGTVSLGGDARRISSEARSYEAAATRLLDGHRTRVRARALASLHLYARELSATRAAFMADARTAIGPQGANTSAKTFTANTIVHNKSPDDSVQLTVGIAGAPQAPG